MDKLNERLEKKLSHASKPRQLNEMARVGVFERFIVYVYGSEGPNPHFHILLEEAKSPTWQCCIRIDRPAYFIHEGKEGTLNFKQKRQLVVFLQSPHKRFQERSNWEIAVEFWSSQNPDHEIPVASPMPDYLRLP